MFFTHALKKEVPGMSIDSRDRQKGSQQIVKPSDLLLSRQLQHNIPFLLRHRLYRETADADERHIGEPFVGLDLSQTNGIL